MALTREEFDALLARRDELQKKHETACLILEEDGAHCAHANYRKCVRLYDELAAVQQKIDDAIAAETAEENRQEAANG